MKKAVGFRISMRLTALVIPLGMTAAHVNDACCRVVTSFGEMKPKEGYKTRTLMTLIIGLAAMPEILKCSLII